MPRAAVAVEKADRVAGDELVLLRGDRGALGVDDALVEAEGGRLGGLRHRDRPLDRHVPGMEEIEVAARARDELGIGEPGGLVGRGEARDRERGSDRVFDGFRREIGGARVAVLLADVHADAEALVAVVLDGLDLAAPDGDALAVAFRDLGLGLARAALARALERVGDRGAQRVERIREPRVGHGSSEPGGKSARLRRMAR